MIQGGAGYRRTSAEAAGRDAQSLKALPTEEAPTHDQEPGLSTTGAPEAHTMLPLRGDLGPMQRGCAPARTTCGTESDQVTVLRHFKLGTFGKTTGLASSNRSRPLKVGVSEAGLDIRDWRGTSIQRAIPHWGLSRGDNSGQSEKLWLQFSCTSDLQLQ